VAGFFNTGICVVYFFLLISNQKYYYNILPHAIKPLNKTFIPIKNLKFKAKLIFFATLKMETKGIFSDKENNISSC
jgi:hypothetical protein